LIERKVMFLEENTITHQVFTTSVIHSTQMTYVAAVMVFAWLAWFIIQRIKRANAKCRKPVPSRNKSLKRAAKVKDELSSIWLRKGESKKIHGIGVGKSDNGEPCIQIFIDNSSSQMFENPPSDAVPNVYKDIPIVLVAMPQASFLSIEEISTGFSAEDYRKLIREKQDVILGGISGANSNLKECGTIGYFCRKRSLIPRKSEIYMLSNSHVFADLRKEIVDEHDLIMQPSPGESGNSRPIGELEKFAHPKLENDTNDANFVDAAIAKLWKQEIYKPLIPMIGTVKGFVRKDDVQVGENARKFGRTTGFTSGKVFSVYLDIWVKYDRTGQSSFFKNQFLIEPDKNINEKFVDKGDSGSLVIDGENYASGLIFAGANGDVEIKKVGGNPANEKEAKIIKNVKNYGVANPLSEVMSKLKIDLL
jgi:hypothetical protein